MLYSKSELKNAFFFRLDTKRRVPQLNDLNPKMQDFWIEKYHNFYKNNSPSEDTLSPAETYRHYADRIAEFSEIKSIEFGTIDELEPNKPLAISVDKINASSEFLNVSMFSAMLDDANVIKLTLGGYNVVNHQIPFLIKKMMAHKVKIPFLLNIRNKKPWDINIIDIMRDYQGNTYGEIDLKLVAEHLNINKTNITDLELSLEVAIAMSI